MNALQEERHASYSPRVVEILARYDVPEFAADICGMARIVAQGQHFEPHPDGAPAIIVPCIEGGLLIDLLAFDPRNPDCWHFRRGDAALLGGEWLDPLIGNIPAIYRTPLAWLQENCAGIVVFDWLYVAPLLISDAYNGVSADSIEHGREIEQHLKAAMPPVPSVFVRERMAA